MTLSQQVRAKIEELGDTEAAKFFDVCLHYVKQWKTGSRAIPAAAMEKFFDFAYQAPAITAMDSGWEGRKVGLALPWYKTVNPVTAFSLLGVFNPATMRLFMVCQDAFIAHARNTLSRMALDAGCEWVLMVDNDMIIPFGNPTWFNGMTGFGFPAQFAGYRTLHRLMSHQKSLVGGLYFGRNLSGKPMFYEGASDPQVAASVRAGPKDFCQPTRWIATGCLLIHRTVFLDINKKYPELGDHWFSPSESDLSLSVSQAISALSQKADPVQVLAVLEEGRQKSLVNAKLGFGEDVIFSLRAGNAGHQPHVDLGLVCGHIGDAVYGPFNTRSTQ